jgi:glucosamine--fructose-6-phosphate aminotransferase (isomerizing)
LIIAVSQSGETADVLDTVRMAKSLGVRVVSIINVVGSSLMDLSDKIIIQGSGYEIAVPATKTYTSQLAVLYVLAYSLIGKVDEAKDNLKEVYNHIFYLTSENAQIYVKELAKQLRYTEHLYLIGRGLEYATALEAAWKIKEVTYIHAEANMGGEPKHGSIALINYGTPCIVFTSDDNDIINNAIELKSRGAYIIGVGPINNEVFDYFIKVRDIKYLNPICQIIPIQILAYTLALLRGCNPDLPKNLAKSLTVR